MTKPTIRHVISNESDQPVHLPSMARVLVHSSWDSLEALDDDDDGFRFNNASTHEGHLHQNGILTWGGCRRYMLPAKIDQTAQICRLI